MERRGLRTTILFTLYHIAVIKWNCNAGVNALVQQDYDGALLGKRLVKRQVSNDNTEVEKALQVYHETCEKAAGTEKFSTFSKPGSCEDFYVCFNGTLFDAKCKVKQAFDGSSCADAAHVVNCEHLAKSDLCNPPCLNGGVCIGSNTCKCPEDYVGYQCLYVKYSDNPEAPVSSVSDIHGGMCTMFGAGNVVTFDGLIYDFPGACQYEMVSSGNAPDFKVLVRKNPNCTRGNKYNYNAGNCIEKVTINIAESSIKVGIENNVITINNKLISIPYDGHGITLTSIRPYIVLVLGDMTLRYDQDMSSVHVLLDSDRYINKTRGLCGNFNAISSDDLKTRQGEAASSSAMIEFAAKSWIVRDVNEICHNSETVTEELTACRADPDVTKICNVLLSHFGPCHAFLHPYKFFDLCKTELCRCDYLSNANCHCHIVTLYSRSCALAGGLPPSWRTENQCYRTCPSALDWVECGDESAQSCAMPRPLPHQLCFDRCQCPPGTYALGTGCVAQANCPCIHRDKEYKPGDRSSIYNCNDCVCQDGRWECESSLCPGTAHVFGFAHYKTFDGKFFTFNGHCQYVFARDCVDRTFAMYLEGASCGSGADSSCLKSFTVLLTTNGQTQEISFREGKSVRINGYEEKLPYQSADLHVFRESSLYIHLTHSRTEIDVLWNSLDSVYVTVPQKYREKLCGLTGNYNGKANDDFLSPQKAVESTAASFGNSWKIIESCPDVAGNVVHPCTLNSEKGSFARGVCRIIYDSRFRPCRDDVDPEPYYQICVRDFCDCTKDLNEECSCDALAVYARTCSVHGIHLEWRSKGFCEITCTGDAIYQSCGTGCGRSCKSLSEPEECPNHCVEGCNCPAGKFLDPSGACVYDESCPCYHLGAWYKPGEILHAYGILCQCSKGRLVCAGKSTLPTSCATGQIYHNCTTMHAAGVQLTTGAECFKTCQNKALPCPHLQCVSGCACRRGLVWHEGRCIAPKSCPCYHNSKTYQNLDTMLVGCNECTCNSGDWKCTEKLCGGECSVIGQSHFRTFDNKWFDFAGDCEYVMATDECGANEGTFKIYVKSLPCETLDSICSRIVTIQLGLTQIILQRNQAAKISQSQNNNVDVPYTISKHGFFIFVTTGIGVTVLWDEGTRVIVQLATFHKTKVCGLCGNYDSNENNDFMKRGRDVTTSSLDFGNHWRLKESCPKTSDNSSTDMCEAHPGRKPWATHRCQIIESNIFAECRNEVDHAKYLEHCLSDTCSCAGGGDCECFCTAVAAYVHSCGQKGIIVNWRTPSMCPTMCEHFNKNDSCEWHYESCGTSCPSTCCHRNAAQCSLPCVEGCHPRCAAGRVFSDEKQTCIDESLCPTCPSSTTTVVATPTATYTTVTSTVVTTVNMTHLNDFMPNDGYDSTASVTQVPTSSTPITIQSFTTTSITTVSETTAGPQACPTHCLDSNNIARQVGEIWHNATCGQLECTFRAGECPIIRQSGNSSCATLIGCTMFTHPAKVQYGPGKVDPDPCCDEMQCVCLPKEQLDSRCPESVATTQCNITEKLSLIGNYPDTNGCCSDYECVCRNATELAELCSDWNKTCLPHETRRTLPVRGCCPQYECKCDKCFRPGGHVLEVNQQLHVNACLVMTCLKASTENSCPTLEVVRNRTDSCRPPPPCSKYEEMYEVTYSERYLDPDICCPEIACRCRNSTALSIACPQWHDRMNCSADKTLVTTDHFHDSSECCPMFECKQTSCLDPEGKPFNGTIHYFSGGHCCKRVCLKNGDRLKNLDKCFVEDCAFKCNRSDHHSIILAGTSNPENPCCPLFECKCDNRTCHQSACSSVETLVVVQEADGVGRCCNEYECVSVQCLYRGEKHAPNETWVDDCSSYSCLYNASSERFEVQYMGDWECPAEVACLGQQYVKKENTSDGLACCTTYYCECKYAIVNKTLQSIGYEYDDPSNPDCYTLKVVQTEEKQCPVVERRAKFDCQPHVTCGRCQTRIESHNDCCGPVFKCVDRICQNAMCGVDQSRKFFSKDDCCEDYECACSCTGIGTPTVTSFQCDQKLELNRNCSYLLTKKVQGGIFDVTADQRHCPEVYPQVEGFAPNQYCFKKVSIRYRDAVSEIFPATGTAILPGPETTAYRAIRLIRISSLVSSAFHTTYMKISIEAIGLSVSYSNPNAGANPSAVGIFSIFLSSTRSGGGTTGICGNCSSGRSSGECAALPPVIPEDHLEDPLCAPPCGVDNTCQEKRCADISPCITCRKCTSFNFTDPCQVLSHPVFALCHQHANVTALIELCQSLQCFRNSSDIATIEVQCDACTSQFIQQQITSCEMKGACADYQQAISCKKGNRTCSGNKVFKTCVSNCEPTCDDVKAPWQSGSAKEDCGNEYFTGCVCPQGYVLRNKESNTCVKEECCCKDPPKCSDQNKNFLPATNGTNDCGCTIYTGACVCEGCIYNGSIFKANETWEHGCTKHTCTPRGDGCYEIVEQNKTCEDPPVCQHGNNSVVHVFFPAKGECCPTYKCECKYISINGSQYPVGSNLSDPANPACRMIRVISVHPDQCPTLEYQPKYSCPVQPICSPCQDEVLEYEHVCCGPVYRCVDKVCPNVTCGVDQERVILSNTECCKEYGCQCKCSGFGSTLVTTYQCKQDIELTKNCTYLVTKDFGSNPYSITAKQGFCSKLYPFKNFPANFKCFENVLLIHNNSEVQLFLENGSIYVNGAQVLSYNWQGLVVTRRTVIVGFVTHVVQIEVNMIDLGLKLIYHNHDIATNPNAVGVFDIYLIYSPANNQMTGLCGSCTRSDRTEMECAQLPPTHQEEFAECAQMDCGSGQTCREERCGDISPCTECRNCSSFGLADPCRVLDNAVFDACHNDMNVSRLHDVCLRTQCFHNGDNIRAIEEQCNVCSSRFVQQHISSCKAKGACSSYQATINCVEVNGTCPSNKVFKECVKKCRLTCDDVSKFPDATSPIDQCDATFISGCVCPNGQVLRSAGSEECVEIKCCNCPEPPTCEGGLFYGPFISDKDECGCNVYSQTCVCRAPCTIPESGDLLLSNATVGSKDGCGTYECPSNHLSPARNCSIRQASYRPYPCPALNLCEGSKVAEYLTKTDACCPVVICHCPLVNRPVCADENERVIYVNGTDENCPTASCSCQCPMVDTARCSSSPGCKAVTTEVSSGRCACLRDFECRVDNALCPAAPNCSFCHEAHADNTTTIDSACNSSCPVYQCQAKSCPLYPESPCPEHQTWEKGYLPDDTDYCCPIYACQCKPSQQLRDECPQWNFTCGRHYVINRTNSDKECCPKYECLCNASACTPPVDCGNGTRLATWPPKAQTNDHTDVCCESYNCTCAACGSDYISKEDLENDLRLGEIVVPKGNPTECCQQYQKVCDPKINMYSAVCSPNVPECGVGFMLRRNFSNVGCCPAFRCECNETLCDSPLPCAGPRVLKTHSSTEDSCCQNYTCVCPKDTNEHLDCVSPKVVAYTKSDCPTKYCRCPRTCPQPPVLDCQGKPGCRVAIDARDDCGCAINVTCVADNSTCASAPQCGTCSSLVQVDVEFDSRNCSSTCAKYECQKKQCPTMSPLSPLCPWNNVAWNYSDPCCPTQYAVCSVDKCPEPNCSATDRREVVPGSFWNDQLHCSPDVRCCRREKCVCEYCAQNDKWYRVGDEWSNSSVSCSTFKCSSDRSSPDGCFVVTESPPSCTHLFKNGTVIQFSVGSNVTIDRCSYLECRVNHVGSACHAFHYFHKETCPKSPNCSVYEELKADPKPGSCCFDYGCVCRSCGPDYSPLPARGKKNYEVVVNETLEENPNQQCCPRKKYVCAGNEVLSQFCPEWNATCVTGKERRRVNTLNECCPQFNCVCKPCPQQQLVSVHHPCHAEVNETLIENVIQECCPATKLVCRNETSCCGQAYQTFEQLESRLELGEKITASPGGHECCPQFETTCKSEDELKAHCFEYNITCPFGFLKLRNVSNVGCCPVYHCKLDETLCPTKPECQLPKTLQAFVVPGEFCKDYVCACPPEDNANLVCVSPKELARTGTLCPTSYCRCPDNCPLKPEMQNCLAMPGCQPNITEKDSCGCVTNLTCHKDINSCSPKPNCSACYETKLVGFYPSVGGCQNRCERYVCEKIQCPESALPDVCQLETRSTTIDENCCQTHNVVCKPDACPNTTCREGFAAVFRGRYYDNSSEYNCTSGSKCCPRMECVCQGCFDGGVFYPIWSLWIDANDSCKINKCSSQKGDDGCYVVTNQLLTCNHQGNAYPAGAYIKTEQPCSNLACTLNRTETQCLSSFDLVTVPCPKPPLCSEHQIPSATTDPSQCCPEFECVCNDCGMHYPGLDPPRAPRSYEKVVNMTMEENKNQQCCPLTKIVCDVTQLHRCPQFNFICDENHRIVEVNSSQSCCPAYECQCRECCSHSSIDPSSLSACQEIAVVPAEKNSNHACCPMNEVVCKADKSCCTIPPCGDYEAPKITSALDAKTGNCCPLYECVCSGSCPDGYQSRETLEANLKRGQVIFVEIPHKCCPKYKVACPVDVETHNVCAAFNTNCDPPFTPRRNVTDVGCCPVYHCVCDERLCPSKPVCPAPQIIEVSLAENGCCNAFRCVCPSRKNETCVPPQALFYTDTICPAAYCRCPDTLECSVNATLDCSSKPGCTARVTKRDACGCIVNATCQVDPSLCPAEPQCGPCYELREAPILGKLDECESVCTNYTCEKKECPANARTATCELEMLITIHSDDSCCPKSEVVCRPGSCPTTVCTAPGFVKEIRQDFVDRDHNCSANLSCCRREECVCNVCHHHGSVYELYSYWTSADNACVRYQCTHGRGADGCYVVNRVHGRCLHNGEYYPVGSAIVTTNPCYTLHCVAKIDSGGTCTHNFEQNEIRCLPAQPCRTSYEPNATLIPGSCCPQYQCVCRPCPDINNYGSPGSTSGLLWYQKIRNMTLVENPSQECCPELIVVCDESVLNRCPSANLSCGFGESKTEIHSIHPCCPAYTCRCNPCREYVSPVETSLYRCQEIVPKTLEENPNQGCCHESKIVCRESCCTIPTCKEFENPYLADAKDPDTNGCCPLYKCRCKSEEELARECPFFIFTCSVGFRRIRDNSQSDCCSMFRCECEACVVGEVAYPVGSNWIDKANHCLANECLSPVAGCPYISTTDKYQCEALNETACVLAGKQLLSNPTTEGCCLTCTRSCDVRENYENITIVNETMGISCSSSAPVSLPICGGACSTTSAYNITAGGYNTVCRCCKALSFQEEKLTLQCTDGSSKVVDYSFVYECGCQETSCSHV